MRQSPSSLDQAILGYYERAPEESRPFLGWWRKLAAARRLTPGHSPPAG
jgi:hypothetical protein